MRSVRCFTAAAFSSAVPVSAPPEKPAAAVPPSPKLLPDEGRCEARRSRSCLVPPTSSRAQQMPQPAMTQRLVSQVGRVPGHLASASRLPSRERSARRVSDGGSWESQLRAPRTPLVHEKDKEKVSSPEPPPSKMRKSCSQPSLACGSASTGRCCSGIAGSSETQLRRNCRGGSGRSGGGSGSQDGGAQSGNQTTHSAGHRQSIRGHNLPAQSASGDAHCGGYSGSSRMARHDSPSRGSTPLWGVPEESPHKIRSRQDSPQVFKPLSGMPEGTRNSQDSTMSGCKTVSAEPEGSRGREHSPSRGSKQFSVGGSCSRHDRPLMQFAGGSGSSRNGSPDKILQDSSTSESPTGATHPGSRNPNRGQGREAASQSSAIVARSASPTTEDPYRLRRFTVAQKATHAQAVSEIRAGRKNSGWMWYEIPTPPHIVKGVERGSTDNRKYALRSDVEVLAFLDFHADGVGLRNNYIELMIAVRDQLRNGRHPTALMGKLSAPKLVSSVRLFERVTKGSADKELHAVLAEVMELLEA